MGRGVGREVLMRRLVAVIAVVLMAGMATSGAGAQPEYGEGR